MLRVAAMYIATGWASTWAAAQIPDAVPREQLDANRQQQIERERRRSELDDFNLTRRVRANELIPVGQRAYIDYGAYLTLSYLTVKDSDGENRGERIYEASAFGRVNIDGVHEFFVRGRYAYFDYFSENDSFDGRGSRDNDDYLDRAYYRFDLTRYLQAYEGKNPTSGLAIQGGRDFVYWANGLTLGQVLDGVVLDAFSGPVTLQAVAGVTPKKDTVDFDSSRPEYDIETRRGFFGGIITVDAGQHQPFFYVLSQRDFNDHGPYTITPSAGTEVPTRFRYDSYYIGIGSTGNLTDRLSYGVEAVYEGGNALSSPVDVQLFDVAVTGQTDSRIDAWALNGRLEYVIPDDYRTRFTLEQTFASGDQDRVASTSNTVYGNRAGTRDHAFNGFGLINPGLAFNPNLANLSITRLGVATFPLPRSSWTRRLQVGLDLFVYNKLARSSTIDEPSAEDGRYLGFEPDLYLNWQVTSDVTLTVRYGYFFPSENLVLDDNDRTFFYAGVTYAF